MDSMSRKPLKIGYSGTLFYYRPIAKNPHIIKLFLKIIRNWVWEYRVYNVDHSTRTATYLFRAVRNMKDKDPNIGEIVQIELWGNIHKEYIKLANDLDINDIVTISGYVTKKESLEKTKKCDVMFLPLETSTNFQKSYFLPAKIFDYLQMKKPVLILSKESDALDVLTRAGLGIACDPGDVDEIAEKIMYLVEQGDDLSGIVNPDVKYIQENFHFKNISKKLADVFENLLDKNKQLVL